MARRPHWALYAALALSVALNLGGAGYLFATAERGRGPRTIDSTIETVAGRYPGATGGAIRAALEKRRAELKAAFDDIRTARRATRVAMKAQPYDPERLEAAFAEARAKSSALQAIVHEAIASAIPGAPPDDRAKITDDKD